MMAETDLSKINYNMCKSNKIPDIYDFKRHT